MANSYRDIFKSTAIFGGTQVIQTIVGVLRGKISSVFLGPKGMGINSLYLSSLSMILNFSGFGLKDSSVRSIAQLSGQSDEDISHKLAVINKCFLFSYVIGIVVTIALSPILSFFSFKCFDYTINYGFLSIYVLFQLQFQKYVAFLQGFRQIKSLAKASICSSLSNLFVAGLLFWLWGIDGIVPNIIISSFVSMLCLWLPVHKMNLPKSHIKLADALVEGKDFISMGITLMISVLIGSGVTYAVNAIISSLGSIEDVGLFHAATSITTQSVSLIFAAMSADYYPRLAKIAQNNNEVANVVNRQTEIITHLGIPILSVMIIASPIIIKVLLSSEFMVINGFIKILCLGTMLQLFSYPIGTISFAKGDRRFFFKYEAIGSNLIKLIAFSFGYKFGGLIGLAWGFCLANFTYLLVVSYATYKAYDYKISRTSLYIEILSIILGFFVLFTGDIHTVWIKISIQSVLLIIIISYHFCSLAKKLDLKMLWTHHITKR